MIRRHIITFARATLCMVSIGIALATKAVDSLLSLVDFKPDAPNWLALGHPRSIFETRRAGLA